MAYPPVLPAFTHRDNKDGTTDSFCRNCFLTVCTSMWEADLERAENDHACDPVELARWHKIASASAKQL
jgi:hypothetical protein